MVVRKSTRRKSTRRKSTRCKSTRCKSTRCKSTRCKSTRRKSTRRKSTGYYKSLDVYEVEYREKIQVVYQKLFSNLHDWNFKNYLKILLYVRFSSVWVIEKYFLWRFLIIC